MKPWESLGTAGAPDGAEIELRRRGDEFLLLARGHDLMSSRDEVSSKALAELGCEAVTGEPCRRVLVGGLGMGFTAREALERASKDGLVEIAELVPAVVEFNRSHLGHLADHPLDDPRCVLHIGDVHERIAGQDNLWDAILLDVDNGPDALAHDSNDKLYDRRGVDRAWQALRPGGVLAVWSFSDDARFTARLRKRGFEVEVHRIGASRSGRGRYHHIWVARRPVGRSSFATARKRKR